MKKIALLFTLAACGPHPHVLRVDPELQAHLDDFIAEGETRGVNIAVDDLIMGFGDTSKGGPRSAGICITGKNKTPEIVINPNYWRDPVGFGHPDEFDLKWGRKSLVFHEAAHCLLGREHDSREVQFHGPYGLSQPASLMHPRTMRSSQFSSYTDEYLDELFSPAYIADIWSRIGGVLSGSVESGLVLGLSDLSLDGNEGARYDQ